MENLVEHFVQKEYVQEQRENLSVLAGTKFAVSGCLPVSAKKFRGSRAFPKLRPTFEVCGMSPGCLAVKPVRLAYAGIAEQERSMPATSFSDALRGAAFG